MTDCLYLDHDRDNPCTGHEGGKSLLFKGNQEFDGLSATAAAAVVHPAAKTQKGPNAADRLSDLIAHAELPQIGGPLSRLVSQPSPRGQWRIMNC